MTELRQRMIQELQLRGYSERTVQAYVHPVAQLARHYRTAPDRLTREQVRDYLLHLTTVQKIPPSTHSIALCGIKFFYPHTLGRDWQVLEIARPRAEKKLPAVLSRDEVARILVAVRIPVYRACLTTRLRASKISTSLDHRAPVNQEQCCEARVAAMSESEKADHAVRRCLLRSSRTAGTSSTGTVIMVSVVSKAASSSATASSSLWDS